VEPHWTREYQDTAIANQIRERLQLEQMQRQQEAMNRVWYRWRLTCVKWHNAYGLTPRQLTRFGCNLDISSLNGLKIGVVLYCFEI
jgi:hypothetical protein